MRPQLATLVDAPPPGKDWLYEAKFDGYRVLIRIDRGAASRPIAVYTREGLDWSAKFAAQLDALARLPVDRGWLDGEAVVLDRAGVPDFQALQNALGAGRSNDVTLFLFDVPFLNGFDLRGVPLERPVDRGWLDGEAVVLDRAGEARARGRADGARRRRAEAGARFSAERARRSEDERACAAHRVERDCGRG
ncbi:ATP-dependen tDNA ligase [Burkholderia pseudomallei]|nr:ATP-dependen tDNA ligase [Burkholderia pseudomallei]